MPPIVRKLLVGLVLVFGGLYFWMRRDTDAGASVVTFYDPTHPPPTDEETAGAVSETPPSILEPSSATRGETRYGPLIVRGRVVTPDGTPVAGVVVEQEHPYLSASAAPSSADGSFQIEVRESHGELVPHSGEWLLLGGDRRLADGRTEDYVLVVAPSATVTGSVADPRGRPLADVALHVLPPGDVLVPFGTVATPIERESQSGWSDRRGAFHIGPVPRVKGSRIEASANGFASASIPLGDDFAQPVHVVLSPRE
jgi:hypothetical protein